MTTYRFESRYGGEHEIKFEKAEYVADGSLAVAVWSMNDEYGGWEPYCNLTVNLGRPHAANEAYLDENNAPELCQYVVENGWARNVGSGQSGWCTYPLVEFTDEFLNDVCEVAA